MFVLDEADEMLSRGFKDQIYDVFKTMPQDIQVYINEGFIQDLLSAIDKGTHIMLYLSVTHG